LAATKKILAPVQKLLVATENAGKCVTSLGNYCFLSLGNNCVKSLGLGPSLFHMLGMDQNGAYFRWGYPHLYKPLSLVVGGDGEA
jgi:hypothetical protein